MGDNSNIIIKHAGPTQLLIAKRIGLFASVWKKQLKIMPLID